MSLVRSHSVSPFAAKKAPPAPVVLLLSQTTLHMPTSPGHLIHEDLKTPVKKLKKVAFAVTPHTYPPPSIVPNLIPTPRHLSTKTVENHKGWTMAATDTELIKRTVHRLTDQLLDTTQCYSKQAQTPLLLVYERALEMHPDLREFENKWATRCIIMAHLKATAATAKAN
ncbi:hypothetical protein B0H16DRAFT_1727291 [Mycena metata]|uniref:Uncharacterized protein n=1 Tax=Mycena metata TaxID=1033252 RepID=A0AAD7IJJ4_9AGAR|nr:hypothetical protein B0H16DRAFT_1727291 [Mycena metata]